MAKATPTGISTWKTIIIIVFTVCAVGGMMYMLFTEDQYNQFASPPSGSATTDSTTGTTTTTTAEPAANGSSYDQPAPSTETKETPPPVTTAPETKPTEETKPVATAVETKPVSAPPPVVKTETKPPAVTVAKPQPTAVAKPAQKTVSNASKTYAATSTKTSKSAAVAPKPSTKEDKVMSDDELQQLLGRIADKANAAAINVKCVQLRNTETGNNKATMRQIENYLRNNKYVIAGRLTVSSQVKGIQVEAGEDCMKVVVGSF